MTEAESALERFAEKYRLKIRRDQAGDPIIPGRRGHLWWDAEGLCLMILDGRPILPRRLKDLVGDTGKVWLGTITLDDHGRRVQDCAATAPARLPAGGLHQGQDCGMPPGRSGLARRMALKRATSRAIAPAGPGKAPVPPRPFRAFLGPLLALRGPLCAATWPLKACPPPRPHAKQAILPPRWPAPPRRRTTKLGPQIAAKTFLCRNVPATISSGG